MAGSAVQLNEAKTKVLTTFEDVFGRDFVYSPNMDFEFDGKTFSKAYSVLNAHLFDGKLSHKKTVSYYCSSTDLEMLVDKMHVQTTGSINELYAAYVPEIDKKTGKLVRESIMFIEDYGKMTFLFAVDTLCHEMIHQYDANYGIFLRVAKEDVKLGIDRSHETPIFVKYMKLAALEGLRVMINGSNTPFDILNQEAIQFTISFQENDNSHFFELVRRLESGEKVPNACLTKRGTVALFVP